MLAIASAVLVGALLIWYAVWRFILTRPRAGEVPYITGGIPFLGVAIPYGKDPLGFLRAQRAKHGEVFTLLVAGKRLTFILNPLNAPAIFKAADLDFEELSNDIGTAAFGYPDLMPMPQMREDFHRVYNVHLQGSSLLALTDRFNLKMQQYLQQDRTPIGQALKQQTQSAGWCTAKLWDLTYDAMFYAGIETIFGDGFWNPELRKQFATFDQKFALLVGGVPPALLKVEALRKTLAGICEQKLNNRSNVCEGRFETYDKHGITGSQVGFFQLTLMWASQANSIPAAFWALFYIARDPVVQKAVMAEWDTVRSTYLKEAAATGQAVSPTSVYCSANVRKLQLLESCIHESLRLATSSIVIRRVLKDMTVTLMTESTPGSGKKQQFRARKGDNVCLFPQLTHVDPVLFTDPLKFRHDRFLAVNGSPPTFRNADGVEVRHAFMPFGGGISMCPGRFFATNEIKLLVLNLLSRFEVTLSPDTPAPPIDQSRVGLGSLQPIADVEFQFRPRAAVK